MQPYIIDTNKKTRRSGLSRWFCRWFSWITQVIVCGVALGMSISLGLSVSGVEVLI